MRKAVNMLAIAAIALTLAACNSTWETVNVTNAKEQCHGGMGTGAPTCRAIRND